MLLIEEFPNTGTTQHAIVDKMALTEPSEKVSIKVSGNTVAGRALQQFLKGLMGTPQKPGSLSLIQVQQMCHSSQRSEKSFLEGRGTSQFTQGLLQGWKLVRRSIR